jgi:arylsulfatase A-like enzyme
MNVWDGFDVEDACFQAVQRSASLIFWRKESRRVDLSLTYSLAGEQAAMALNGTNVEMPLISSPVPRTVIFPGDLRPGLNWLNFRASKKGRLRIYNIDIGSGEETGVHHLRPGDSVAILTRAGRGFLSFGGRGEIDLHKVEFVGGEENVRTERFKTSLFSRTLIYKYELDHEGYIRAEVLSGRFNIGDYEHADRPAPPDKSEPRIPMKTTPSIFIFLIDACQAAHLSAYGYRRKTSPNFEKLAEDGVLFENAYTSASFTRSSVATLFTGLYPERHKVRIERHGLDSRFLTIPEFLKSKGYRTAIFTSAAAVSTRFGFSQGVDDYYGTFGSWEARIKRGESTSQFYEWIANPGPLFAYLHFMEPHFPIIPPPPFLDMFRSTTLTGERRHVILTRQDLSEQGHVFSAEEIQNVVDDYDSTIAYIDGELGKIFDHLRRSGVYDDSLIILLSDHGEGLGEHGAWSHGSHVYEEITRVPMIVKFPEALGWKGRVRRVVQIADIFPTIIDLFGQEIGLDGESLLRAIDSPDLDDRLAVCWAFSTSETFGMRWRNWYYIRELNAGKERLFRLDGDPLTDVADEEPAVRTFFHLRFLDWYFRASSMKGQSVSIDLKKLPPEEIENLRSLGYLR